MLAIAPLRLERSHNFDLLILPENVQKANERTLKFIRRSLQDIFRHKVQNRKRPDTLLIAGNTDAIANDIRTLFYPHYQTVGVKKTSLNFLGEIFVVQKGYGHVLYLQKNTVIREDPWIAIAYGDTLAQASVNYLHIFAAEHYPWHKCTVNTASAFAPGWQFSVSGAFVPQDADFEPAREMLQIQQLTNNFYTGKLLPLSVLLEEVTTKLGDKQLQAIYKNTQLWQLSPPMSYPKKVRQHDRLLWMERSPLILQEMKIG